MLTDQTKQRNKNEMSSKIGTSVWWILFICYLCVQVWSRMLIQFLPTLLESHSFLNFTIMKTSGLFLNLVHHIMTQIRVQNRYWAGFLHIQSRGIWKWFYSTNSLFIVDMDCQEEKSYQLIYVEFELDSSEDFIRATNMP